jgi:c-di-GMP-binding flagellar brake protein YcgR
MATAIRFVEKDTILHDLIKRKIPVKCFLDKTEYRLVAESINNNSMVFSTNKTLKLPRNTKTISLQFELDTGLITFNSPIENITISTISIPVPDALYKNLGRGYARISLPSDVEIEILISATVAALNLPQAVEVDNSISKEFSAKYENKSSKELMAQIAAWLKSFADGSKLVIFRGKNPGLTEERIVAEKGKILFIPDTTKGVPKNDPSPQKHYIDDAAVKQFFVSNGQDSTHAAVLTEDKYNEGILSEMWVPIVFQHYIVGYVKSWVNSSSGKNAFTYKEAEILFQLCKMLGFSLNKSGYFGAPVVQKPEIGNIKILDLSASGFLAAIVSPSTSLALEIGSMLKIKLKSPARQIQTEAAVVRAFQEGTGTRFYGCAFVNMAPEDIRFLFECIYGKKFTAEDAEFLAGQV